MGGERRIYRTSIVVMLWVFGVMVAGGIVLLGRLYSRTDLVGAGLMWTGVGYAACCVLALAAMARSATVVTDAGLRLRGLFRSRFYPWTEIADIQADHFGGIMFYDNDLRQVHLPNVPPRKRGDALFHALTYLTTQWESRRGPGWQSRAAELTQQAADRLQHAEAAQKSANTFSWAVIAALTSFVAIMVLMVATADDAPTLHPLVELLIWPGFLVVPVVVFLLVVAIGAVRRRARTRRY